MLDIPISAPPNIVDGSTKGVIGLGLARHGWIDMLVTCAGPIFNLAPGRRWTSAVGC